MKPDTYFADRFRLLGRTFQELADAYAPEPDAGFTLVRAGDNLPSLLEMAPGGAEFRFEAGFRADMDFDFTKPLTLAAGVFEAPPTIYGHQIMRADVDCDQIQFEGVRRNASILRWLNETGRGPAFHDCAVKGSVNGQRRGIETNGFGGHIFDGSITNIWHEDDAQAIMGWDGCRGLRISGGIYESSGENMMFGGGDSSSPSRMAQDIEIVNVTLRKPIEWLGKPGCTVKTIFELKGAKRVTFRNNVLENVWANGQVGYAFVFTPRNQDGGAAWSTVEDVLIEGNTVRHMGGGIQILGRDNNHPSGILRGLTIRGNTFEDIDPQKWGGTGRQVFIAGGPHDVTLEGNTFDGQHINTFLSFEESLFPAVNLRVLNNRGMEGDYGIHRSGGTPGISSLEASTLGYTWANNTLVRTVAGNNIPYPPGTIIETR